ncbi:paraquat-inducible protein A [Azospirillum brasilense]|uniref:Paraquat-inducible membrane protein A n=1 Tax=Azospirillum brasilense TaxID=192 RepID=A0A235HEE5_AZOBR|nr:paraquat-inducible protein A [Azospirillum brasilense]OYD83873.1 paraquat-inducible membrane protein A [Azospirillum brasilense]
MTAEAEAWPPASTGLADDRLVACPECDRLHVRLPLRAGEKARCIRCGTVLQSSPYWQPDQMLALVMAALIAFLLANAYPILELRVQGSVSRATLLDAILALWREDRQLVAALVFATGWLAPLVDLLVMAALLAAVLGGRRPAFFAPLLRLLQQVRPWGMIEVLMLGVFVSLIKLSHLAQVVPGVALWAFVALTVLLAAVLSYDPRCLWQAHPSRGTAA